MSLSPVFVRPNDVLGTVITMLASSTLHRVTVVDERNHPVGVVSLSDVIGVVAARLFIPADEHDGDDEDDAESY